MNWIPFGGVIPGPVEFGAVGGVGWLLVAMVAAVPAALVASRWFEIGIAESVNALVDLAAPDPAEQRTA